jgi:DNA-binding MarR family transcriptional regulator
MTDREQLIQLVHSDIIRMKHLMLSTLPCKPSELPWAQIDLLFRVTERPGITAGQLAENLGTSPSAIAQLVSPLEKQGLIVKETDPSDRRISLLTATPLGCEKLERMKTVARQHLSELMADLSDGELRTLHELQQKMIARRSQTN